MKKVSVLLSMLLFLAVNGFSQVAINTDGSIPNTNAILDVKSTNKGMLIPRMSQVEITAIPNPANGLQAFNTDDGKIYVYLLADNQWKAVQYDSDIIIPPASYTIGTGSSCATTTVNGNYYEGVILDGSNAVTLDATVTTTGTWSITTNSVNGYSFSGSGTFATIGTIQVTLDGTGTPTIAQTDNFTATANGSGGSCTFSVTMFTCGNPIFYGGQSYNTVQIGTQCWMAENLNIGTMVNGIDNQTDNGTIEKYCYDNSTSNCDTYGGLYQWDEMMQYVTTEGAQGICPPTGGWHLPTDAEWCTLEQEVDPTITCSSTGWRGVDGGSKLKETGTSHWTSPNTGATNSSGFTGLPGGIRHTNGSFDELNSHAYFWSSSESGAYAWRRHLYYNFTQVHRDSYNLAYGYGFSVRCVKN
ncbi:MAG: fibrobacter succinogenes major paralogous domain-containing protein [Pseudomonadota bacterium]